MKQYLVSETELENVSFINGASILCFSVGSFLLSWPVNRVIEFINAAPGAARPEPVFWVFGILSMVCFGAGWFARRKHGSIYSIIRKETIHDEDG